MKIVRLTQADAKAVRDINRLLPQLLLSGSGKRISLSYLTAVVADKRNFLFTLTNAQHIVGMGTLVITITCMGRYGCVEDVVIDTAYRGQGLGRQLMKKIIAEAKKLKLDGLELSSRPARVAANSLYQKLGFSRKETNVYELKL